jgi:N-methylhydantoinase A
MESGLAALGFRGTVYMMLSEGGVTTLDVARAFPVRLAESGPAAGAIGAAYYGELLGHADVVSFDMGGTTAKLCIISGGRPSRTNEVEVEVAREHRFKKGSGLTLKTPSIDMIEIGAGGGSIAFIDPMGLMKVGPQSAGADPGPACYGLGGTDPTVTDADLVLGLLNPGYFLGGDMSLDTEAARRAIEERLAKPMGMSVVRAAQEIHEVVNENMATAARMHAAERGLDVRGHALIAFGGAGPVHAYRVAKLLGVKKVVCPLGAGVMSSIGMLVAPKSFDSLRSHISRLDSADWDHVNSIYEDMESRAADLLWATGAAPEDVTMQRSADMRYVGQGFEIVVPIPGGKLGPEQYETLAATFTETYHALFQGSLTDVPVEAITWRLSASEPPPRPKIRFRTADTSTYPGGVKDERQVYILEEGRFVDCRVLDRYSLEPGATVDGPAIVEERESTVFVGADARSTIDEHLNLVMDLG